MPIEGQDMKAKADRWRAFDRTLAEVRDALAELPTEELQAMLDEACWQTRQEMLSAGRDDIHG